MINTIVAAIYERLWRPVGVAAFGLYGLSAQKEREEAAERLRLRGNQQVLDVACGPGNFTNFFGSQLSGDGIAVGFDISRPMIAQAVRDNRSSHAAYVRGDARRLPFDDATFDAVCCYAALYLVPDPFVVVDEMLRVLAPGGRIAIMTSYGSEIAPIHAALSLGAKTIGVRIFDRSTFPAIFTAAGLVDIKQQTRGTAQYVSAHRL
ncbi:methyltransferase domain-containing protein [Antrihabitans cavernicola]|uniref:Methyltransferase domain-containing protein n=2 Tax=Antrihabitans cavernicola TaxID=2495913 RepID=A0A5A7SDV6_9NOCA|nr:methyltransferase domain-containing protein [Spelaeibacter cavernicola]